ncbi:MAG TPA: sigma-70 family RNA polymerase sigma factor [Bacilli bacterium]|nr:sigma-70 family RNA polymerase sigma factor [Bacilli bacterium]
MGELSQSEKKTALEELMDRFGQDVWNFAFTLTRNVEMANDISQDVFVRAYEKLDEFRGESSIKTWLLKITRNRVIDTRRSAFFRKVSPVEFVSPNETHPSAERVALDRISSEEIWNIVLSLPIKFREVLLLHSFQHLSIREISETLEIPDGTVKSRLRTARQKVLRVLKEGE